VDAGTLKVVGTDREAIVRETFRLLTDKAEHARMAGATNPYGDGKASQRIVETLSRVYGAGRALGAERLSRP
jgi:UDP-N-acetylglucosamine 2-epimerase (non-hydrolysing)